MKLEEQVTSLELSKKLKELGVKQESLFYWLKNSVDDYEVTDRGNVYMPKDTFFSAFTVPELGKMSPTEIFISNKRFDKLTSLRLGHKWCTYYASTTLNRMTSAFCAETEAGARGKMLIYLLENKHVTL